MKRTMKRTLTTVLVLAAAVAAMVVLPLAQAGTAKNHAVSATVRSNQVQTIGDVTIDAARVTGGLGEGAALIRSKSAGAGLDVTFKLWYTAGLQRGAGTLTVTPNPDGSIGVAGNLRYTSGTGTFRGITGRLHLDGTLDPNTGVVTAKVTGNARY
jgi:hypothetical protein